MADRPGKPTPVMVSTGAGAWPFDRFTASLYGIVARSAGSVSSRHSGKGRRGYLYQRPFEFGLTNTGHAACPP